MTMNGNPSPDDRMLAALRSGLSEREQRRLDLGVRSNEALVEERWGCACALGVLALVTSAVLLAGRLAQRGHDELSRVAIDGGHLQCEACR